MRRSIIGPIRFGILFLAVFIGLPCASMAAGSVTIDFSKQTATGYPDVFGGNHNRGGFRTQALCDAHHAAGFRSVRIDASIQRIVPGSTIADYKNNVNAVQDAGNWNFTALDKVINQFKTAGFHILLIIDYDAPWLSYSGKQEGVPKDWTIWEDIVKKVYLRYQDKITYVEIWNEPDLQFLSEAGSPYSRITAVKEIFRHSLRAIRSVNLTVPVGGPALSSEGLYGWLDSLLIDPEIASGIGFASFHTYSTNYISASRWKAATARHNKPNLPICITEWNSDWQFLKIPLNSQAPEAISFVGKILISQIKESIMVSSMYQIAQDVDFYTVDAADKFVPKVSTFRLMSVQLGLGKGQSKICQTTSSGISAALGGINSDGKTIVCLANDANTANTVTVTLNNLGGSGSVSYSRYNASRSDSASKAAESQTVTVANGNAVVSVAMPAYSVAGLILDNGTTGIVGGGKTSPQAIKPSQKEFAVDGRTVLKQRSVGIVVEKEKGVRQAPPRGTR